VRPEKEPADSKRNVLRLDQSCGPKSNLPDHTFRHRKETLFPREDLFIRRLDMGVGSNHKPKPFPSRKASKSNLLTCGFGVSINKNDGGFADAFFQRQLQQREKDFRESVA
jgi:hypothetical protein